MERPQITYDTALQEKILALLGIEKRKVTHLSMSPLELSVRFMDEGVDEVEFTYRIKPLRAVPKKEKSGSMHHKGCGVFNGKECTCLSSLKPEITDYPKPASSSPSSEINTSQDFALSAEIFGPLHRNVKEGSMFLYQGISFKAGENLSFGALFVRGTDGKAYQR